MSLITQPLVPTAASESETFGVVQNFFEDVMFIGPDGAASVTSFYKAYMLAGMFVQRRGSCSIYTANRDTLIFEFHQGNLRGKTQVLDAIEDLLKMLATETGIAARLALERAGAAAAQSSDAGSAPTYSQNESDEQAERTPQEESADEVAGTDQAATPNRFRRRGR